MIIIHSESNLLLSEEQYLIHQCNCVSRRAAHLSKSVFRKFPYADIYSGREKEVSIKSLPEDQRPGTILVRGDGDSQRYIVNLLGQVFPGTPKFETGIDTLLTRERYFLSGIQRIFTRLDPESIALPWRIGCGAAGGRWPVYASLIYSYSLLYPRVNIHIYSQKILCHIYQEYSVDDTIIVEKPHDELHGCKRTIVDVRETEEFCDDMQFNIEYLLAGTEDWYLQCFLLPT